jgi:hypothetical protein
MFAICRAISLSSGSQSSFPHIIMRTMWASNCPPGGTNSRTAETVGSVKRSCPFRKLYPAVLVVQSSQDRNGEDGARTLDCSMQGRIFL